MPADVQNRRALYYPYIHPRNANWVKGTLLAFGQLHRIVPDGYPLNDLPEVAWVSKEMAANGEPLIVDVSPDMQDIEDAQRRLHQALQRVDPTRLRTEYGWDATVAQFEKPDAYEIYADKVNGPLHAMMQQHGLAWVSRQSTDWIGMHPLMGDTIMSVSAIAAARRRGLDVVTESGAVHTALATLDEHDALGRVMAPFAPPPVAPAASSAQVVDELGHVIMTVMLDLDQLSMKSVAELVRNGDDLIEFRKAIAAMAATVPNDADPAVRHEMLRERADEIVTAWKGARGRTSKILLGALKDTGEAKATSLAESMASDLAKAAVTGTVGAAAGGFGAGIVGAAAGFAVGFFTSVVPKLLRPKDKSDPLRYLSRIEKAGGVVLAVGTPMGTDVSAST